MPGKTGYHIITSPSHVGRGGQGVRSKGRRFFRPAFFLAIYDVTGRLVREVVNGSQPAGVHRVSWDGGTQSGDKASTGVYLLKFNAPGVAKTTKVLLVR